MVGLFSEVGKGEETKAMFVFSGQGEGMARKKIHTLIRYLLFP